MLISITNYNIKVSAEICTISYGQEQATACVIHIAASCAAVVASRQLAHSFALTGWMSSSAEATFAGTIMLLAKDFVVICSSNQHIYCSGTGNAESKLFSEWQQYTQALQQRSLIPLILTLYLLERKKDVPEPRGCFFITYSIYTAIFFHCCSTLPQYWHPIIDCS